MAMCVYIYIYYEILWLLYYYTVCTVCIFPVNHQVEIEVPQTCNFVLHTKECVLSEVSVIDAQGQPVYRQAAGAEAFQVAMEKYVEQPLIYGIFLPLNRGNTPSSFSIDNTVSYFTE